MPAHRIETLVPRHAKALNQLTQRAMREHPTAFTTHVEQIEHRSHRQVAAHLRELQHSRGFRLGAFDADDNLIGTVRLNPRSGARLAHSADVVFLYVIAEQQNHGVGRELLDELIRRALEIDGLRQLELSVSRDSQSALRLYRRAGFSETGELKQQIRVADQFYDLITMWRSLEDG